MYAVIFHSRGRLHLVVERGNTVPAVRVLYIGLPPSGRAGFGWPSYGEHSAVAVCRRLSIASSCPAKDTHPWAFGSSNILSVGLRNVWAALSPIYLGKGNVARGSTLCAFVPLDDLEVGASMTAVS